MTTALLIVIVATVAGLAGASLAGWRREPRVASGRRTGDDMFAYTMYDDPC